MSDTRPELTFIIAHYNGSALLNLCIDSIRRYTPEPYRIWIGDNDSDPAEAEAAEKLIGERDRFFRFPRPYHHPSILQALYASAKTRYVVVLDQDCILISPDWFRLFEELQPPYCLLAGARDQCLIRNSPQMVHVSFLILDKSRMDRRLQDPLFYGDAPGYGAYDIGQAEPYHALSCKALRYHPDSIVYLEPLTAEEYRFGTFWCHRDEPIAYHQWYSGRISRMADSDIIDGYDVGGLRRGMERFSEDYRTGRLRIPVGRK